MDTSKESNTTPQQDHEPDSSGSSSPSNSDSQDLKLYPSDTSECSNPGWRPLRSPGTWEPAKPRTMSMEYATAEDLKMPEMLLPDPCVGYNDGKESEKDKEVPKVAVGVLEGGQSPPIGNYHQPTKETREKVNDGEYSPKTLPRPLNNSKKNDSILPAPNQPPPKWKIIEVHFDPVSRHLGDFTAGIITVTLSAINVAGVDEETQLYTVQHEVNLPTHPRPGVPWYPTPKPPPYQPRPK